LATFVAYAISLLVVAILWVNHHHVMSRVASVDGPLLWWNNLLLFWMSLVPFYTAYLGEHPLRTVPVAAYGADLCACSTSFWILRTSIAARDEETPTLHRHPLRKNAGAALLYAISVPLAWCSPFASFLVFLAVPALYFMPQRGLEEAK
jgi:uncharacterized membrane protein